MPSHSLQTFVETIRDAWAPLTSEVVAASRIALQRLLRSENTEPWLASLHRDQPDREELYRDPDHGFILLAHTEHAGLYRPPHDHGRGWVVYGLQAGEMEMCTYARVDDENGVRLVKRDATRVLPGQALVYLPGDIHDTRCLSEDVLLFRFTDRDLRIEDRQEQRVTRYHQRNGVWTAGT
jgi:hypothetical protein